jgi:putative ABC transport system substrate-binding protein
MGKVRRREFLIASGGLLAAQVVHAQSRTRIPTLGILTPHPRSPAEKPGTDIVSITLKKHGWIVGETLLIERPDAGGREERLPELAASLVAKKVDVIWALGPEAALAAARATRTIPIVFWGVAFPIEQGFIESYARPGRNVTGVAWYAAPEVDAKRLELLKQIAPARKRLALLSVPTAARTVEGKLTVMKGGTIPAAAALGYELHSFAVEKQEDFEGAYAAILGWRAEAITVSGTTLTVRERGRIVDFANRNRLPSAYTLRDFVEAGGLVSYAIDWRPTMARSMEHVDRILRGANPATLPVDLPSSYETAVNLKTARLLGLTIPTSILLGADRVIE